ncbi:MAG: LruC domain-containing protein [Leptospiraceae bacterium]|nr:LruC domain-containing protein [Leptospiraceae bacterium]
MKKFTILVITLFIFFNCNGKRKGFLPILGFGTVSENSSNSSILTNSQFVTYTTNVTGGYIKEISISSSKEKEEETKITIANAIPTAKVEIDTRTREDFNYQTIRNIPVDMIVYDSNGSFMPNTLITITDGSPTNSEINIIFQQVTNSEGHVSGSIDVNTSVTQVEASVCIGDSSSIPVPIPLRVNTCKEKENNCKTTKGITKIGDIIVPVDFNRVETKITDEDGDGVDDIMDFYPDNPNKAFKIRFPSTGVNTISYEDLFPSAGDADLNDYTIQTYMEEDLNGKGEVVEIRGYYQHVAKGADYDHTLNLRLPDSVEIESFESVILDYKGNNTKTGKLIKFPSKDIIQDGLEILGNGNKTISSKNSSKKDKYKPGHIARAVFPR